MISLVLKLRERSLFRPVLVGFALLSCLAFSLGGQESAEEGRLEKLPFSNGDSLWIRNNAGVVEVRTWKRNEVEARWLIQRGASSDTRVEFLKSGKRIFLLGSSYANSEIKMELRVPSKIDLDIRGIQSQVFVDGVQGSVGVGTLRGPIHIMHATGAVSAFSNSGNILYHATDPPRAAIRLVTVKGDIHCHLAREVDPGVMALTARHLESGGRVLRGSDTCQHKQGKPCLTLISNDTGRVYLYRSGAGYSWHDGEAPSKSQPPELLNKAAAPPADSRPASSENSSDSSVPSFRVGVDLVRLNVSVSERVGGRRISGLQADEFEIYEDGILQQIQFFQDTEEPFHLLLLLDVSTSTTASLPLLRAAAHGFAETLRADDQIAVAAFNTHPFLVQEFTHSPKSVAESLRRIPAGGGTGFYEALDFGLDRLRGLAGRKAMVVVTDGVDDMLYGVFELAADVTFPEVLQKAEETDVQIYIVALDSERILRDWLTRGDNEPLTDPALREARRQLQAISEQSGTPLHSPTEIGQLAPMFAGIAADLKHRYTIGYRSNNPVRDNRWRQITVKISNHPEYAVRTRKGYYSSPTSTGTND